MATVFSRARKDLVVAVLAAAGAAGALTGCSSNEATYRPAPSTTKTPSKSCGAAPAPTYTPPAATAPRPAAPPQVACGKGKCG